MATHEGKILIFVCVNSGAAAVFIVKDVILG